MIVCDEGSPLNVWSVALQMKRSGGGSFNSTSIAGKMMKLQENHLKTRHVYDILISGYRVIYLTGRNALVTTASSPVLGISDISNFIRMYLL